VLATLNRDADALATLDRALVLTPHNAEALNSRGNVLLKLKRPAEALAAFEQAAAAEPRHLGARLNRGNALAELGRFADAIAQYDALLAVIPGHADVHLNRGNALRGLGRDLDAIAAYDRALAARANYPKALTNRGIALQTLGRHAEALASFRALLAIDKNHPDARHNEALALLTLGEFRRGFEGYEARWDRTGMPPRRRFGKPLWLGEFNLARKTILLHSEQGLGDTIQFVRYAPILARSGAKVLLEVQPELKGILARVEGIAGVSGRGEPLPDFDVHCPVGSLPHALGTEPATIPSNIPYLKVNDERAAKWHARLEALASPRVALVWAGSTAHANDRNRSIALPRLAPLLQREHGAFISIQRELRGEDAAMLTQMPRVTHVGDELGDFDDTAAIVSLADLVITVDTSVAHLAGALGRPTWILVPFWPDWRWLLDRDDSPWYPTVRLFRQPAPGDWEAVIAQVGAALEQRQA
jgi:Flp pilus assembly protein TadD